MIAIAVLLSLKPAGLSIDWVSAVPFFGFDVLLAGLWIHLWKTPGGSREWFVAEVVAAFLLIMTASHVLAPAQYVAAATKRPLVDAVLARADSVIGIDAAQLAAWTRAHPSLSTVLTTAYFSFLPQLAVLVPLVGFVARDRDAMWEAVFHFNFCAVITVVALALFPAAHAFQYLHFDSTLDQTRLIAQFNGIRDGTFTTIQFNNLEGLVSMPSFHFAGALIVMWALRRHPLLFLAAVGLNALLTASTVLTGTHYAVDLLGTLVMFQASVWCWNGYARGLVESTIDAPESHECIPRATSQPESTSVAI
jgi:Na+/H+-translocating membrane pyrophosphatase